LCFVVNKVKENKIVKSHTRDKPPHWQRFITLHTVFIHNYHHLDN